MVIYVSLEHKRFAALTSQNIDYVATHSHVCPDISESESSGISDTTSHGHLDDDDPSINTNYQDSQILFEGILALRHTFGRACGYIITYRDLAERCGIERHNGKPCIVFNCEGMLFDGLGLPECSCNGLLAKEDPMVFHGTKDLYGVLASDGIMRESSPANSADGKIGWYHSTNFKTALGYASKMQLGRSFWQPVLQVKSKCWNRVRSWGYTKKLCKRYSVHKIYLVK